jgi:hypothetical protein
LLDKFKEKKSTVVTAINEAIDTFLNIKNFLPDVLETLEVAWKSKVPPVKSNTLSYCAKLVLKTPKANLVKIAKPLSEKVIIVLSHFYSSTFRSCIVIVLLLLFVVVVFLSCCCVDDFDDFVRLHSNGFMPIDCSDPR